MTGEDRMAFESAEEYGRKKMRKLFNEQLTMYQYKEMDDPFCPFDFKLVNKYGTEYYCELKNRMAPYTSDYTDEWYVDRKKIDRLIYLAEENNAIPMFITITADDIALFWYAREHSDSTASKIAGKTTMGDTTKINHSYYIYKTEDAIYKIDLKDVGQ